METQVSEILKNFKASDKSSLIPVLQEVQSKEGYISSDSVTEISKFLRISKSHIFGVITFYQSFSLTPKGKCRISICMGTACHVRGAPLVVEEFERQLGIKAGETTSDMKFSIETVNCLGACALGPVVVVDGKYHGQMNIGKAQILLDKLNGIAMEEINE